MTERMNKEGERKENAMILMTTTTMLLWFLLALLAWPPLGWPRLAWPDCVCCSTAFSWSHCT